MNKIVNILAVLMISFIGADRINIFSESFTFFVFTPFIFFSLLFNFIIIFFYLDKINFKWLNSLPIYGQTYRRRKKAVLSRPSPRLLKSQFSGVFCSRSVPQNDIRVSMFRKKSRNLVRRMRVLGIFERPFCPRCGTY